MNDAGRYLDPTTVEQLNQLQLAARRVVEGSSLGLHRSPFKGASVEFRQHRAYVPGDEPRRLDWRVLARTDRPFVKEYDEETNLRCLIMIDCSGSMGYGVSQADALHGTSTGKIDYACRVAAALAFLMLSATESVGLALLNERVRYWLPPRGGSRQLARFTGGLDRATAAGSVDLPRATGEAVDRVGRRAMVVVLSDFFSPPEKVRDAVARLGHDRHETVCLRVLHPDEQTFPFTNVTRFKGLEGEPPRQCEPAVVRATYLRNFQDHDHKLADLFRSASCEYHTVTTDVSVIDSVTRFLRYRSLR